MSPGLQQCTKGGLQQRPSSAMPERPSSAVPERSSSAVQQRAKRSLQQCSPPAVPASSPAGVRRCPANLRQKVDRKNLRETKTQKAEEEFYQRHEKTPQTFHKVTWLVSAIIFISTLQYLWHSSQTKGIKS